MDYIRHTNALDLFYSNMEHMARGDQLREKSVYMFGTSKVASMIISYLKKYGIRFAGILDNNHSLQGKNVFGLKVFSPEIFRNTDASNVAVLIASGFQDAMISQLEDMGLIFGESIFKVIDLPDAMSDYSFADRAGFVPLTDDEVIESQLRVLCCIKKICEEKGYRYYLAYGTLIGAIRHHGYIPWDDDIDIYVDIRDLENLMKDLNMEKDFGGISTALDMDYYDVVSMAYDRHTVCDSNHFPMQISAGVTIDIFPLFGMPGDDRELEEYFNEVKEAELRMIGSMYKKEEREDARKFFIQLLKKYDMDTAERKGCFLSSMLLRDAFPARCFEDAVDVTFEGETFRAPSGYDEYLRMGYGDYMTPIPEDQRKKRHFYHVYHEKNR